MEYSKTNLLEAVNKVLENIGERRVLSINTPVGRKAVEALRDSVIDISTLADYEWLREFIPAQSWTNERADLGDVQRIHAVQYGDIANGYRNIENVDPRVFDFRGLEFYATNSRPRYWTQETYNIVRVNPYPTTAEEQARIRFYVTREMVPPANVTDKFPIPERHMTMLYYRAQSMLAITHLDDNQLAAQWGKQFEAYVQRVRDRERLKPTSGGNAFKLRALYG